MTTPDAVRDLRRLEERWAAVPEVSPDLQSRIQGVESMVGIIVREHRQPDLK